MSLDLIDRKFIADATGLAQAYVTDRLTKRPDFPKPVLRLSRKVVKWARADFDKWFAAQGRRAAR
ncbi:MAG: AlpA family phage regulatory protein [Pseudomonadota bacterium]